MDITSIVLSKYSDYKDKIISNIEKAKSKSLDKIIKDTEPYVPYKTGSLSNSVVKNVATSTISYTAPHASFAFEPIAPSGKPKEYNQSVHTKAQGYPIQAAYNEHSQEWAEFFAKELLEGVE